MPISLRIACEAELIISPTLKSCLPSRTSATRVTTKPVNSVEATSPTIEATRRSTMPWSSVRIPWMTPAITKTIAAAPSSAPTCLP